MLNDWRFFALLSAFFAALTAVFGKVGVTSINSNLATFLRTVVILTFAACVVSYERAWRLPHEIGNRGVLFLVLSGLATALSWLCYFRALQLGPVSKVAPLDKMSVAIVIVLSTMFLGEALTLKTIVGGLLIVCGSAILVL